VTITIVAWDASTGELGTAVATATAVDVTCAVVADAELGIAASQGALNPDLPAAVLGQLRGGASPDQAVQAALTDDPGRAGRQLFAVDVRGRTAAFSGGACQAVFGHTRGTDHVAGGESLESANSIGAMSLSFERSGGDPLAERLLLALESGLRAGGDRRGTTSARLVVFARESSPRVDLRVEDHPQPGAELRRLLGLSHERG
jgi:uncharacterized Ntn-hydrolase superfamily protein